MMTGPGVGPVSLKAPVNKPQHALAYKTQQQQLLLREPSGGDEKSQEDEDESRANTVCPRVERCNPPHVH